MSGKRDKKAVKEEKPEVVNLVFDDTATTSGLSEAATPAPDKVSWGYGAEFDNAFLHIMRGYKVIISISPDNFGGAPIDEYLDGITSHSDKVVIGWTDKPSSWIITEMAKRNFAVNNDDTKYLRIAVKFAQNRTLKDTILVFSKRK